MRLSITLSLLLFSVCLAGFSSCTEKEEAPSYEPVESYFQPKKGKYITYRLDSLVTTSFNLELTTHSYQVKHVIDDSISDILGRPAYRVYRYLNDENASGQWVPNGSYTITVLNDKIEVTEDNLRFVKLRSPMREDFTWRGNSFLPTNPYEPYGFKFDSDDNIQKWDYIYEAPEASFTYKGNTYNDVLTVEQQDYSHSLPVTPATVYAMRNRAVEKYSKGIGMIYREYILWDYQIGTSNQNPTYVGFGITMWMIDHN